MNSLSLFVLGSFRAVLGNEPLPGFRTHKVQALLLYLAVEPGSQRRETLMALLWPGLPDRSARGNLRQIIYLLRKAVPEVAPLAGEDQEPVPLLIANRQTLQLNPAADITVDAHQFEEQLERVNNHDHLDLPTCLACRQELEEAVQLYDGNFLEDFYLDDSNEFEDWAQARREIYRRKALDALEILATIYANQKDYPQARRHVERQLEIDNLRESAFRQLMEIMALNGQRSEALAVYENCRRILAEELGMEPAARTTQIYEQILAGDLSFVVPLAQGVRGYELKDEIGQGAYGAIHRAVQPGIGREVAVKVIRRKYANDPEFIRRFEAEAQTIARLEHPYIVPLYDYWRDPEGAYLVMRYLRGGSLLSALSAGPWNPEQAVKMLDQVASALSAAHCQGVIHRDIKPGNILLDPAGNSYLSDFGVAKKLDDERQMTAEGTIIGTFDYISPEQILDDPVGPQSDIYSLGAVLYETLTGERPFIDVSAASLLYKHLNEAVPLVSSSRPDLPPQIDVVIQQATAKRPADRYTDALEMAQAFRQAVQASDVALAVTLPDAPPAVEVYNPYKGLRAFQEADAEDFFGREALVEQLVARLDPALAGRNNNSRWAEARFMAVVGPSGSGKSSAVKAGLIPALRDGAVPAGRQMAASDKWFVAEMVPGNHPLEELELALWPIAVDPPPSLVEPMQKDTRGLLRTIRRVLPDEEGAQLLLIIDQFEELFTLVEDEKRRSFFIDSLLIALRAPRTPLRVVVTLRADFYDRPLAYESLGRLLKDNTEVVLPLTAEELIWAIQEPARRVGVSLETGLAPAIVSDLADQPGALPLLQYALTELFERRKDSLMTRDAYENIGGVLGALGRRAEELYAGLDESSQGVTRQIFLRLVTLGEGVEDTRRRVLRAELEALAPDDEQAVSDVLDEFGRARLLIFDRDPMNRLATVEVAHEALLREWQRLRRWLDESRDDIRMQRLLTASASEWLENAKEAGFLLREARLDQFSGWVEANTVALTPDENDYLQASIAAREARLAEEEERRQRELAAAQALAEAEKQRAEIETKRAEEQALSTRKIRRNARLLAAVAVVAVILAIAAGLLARQAQNERQNSQRQTAVLLANQAENDVAAGYHDRAVLLALAALEDFPYTAQAEHALGQAVTNNRALQQYTGHTSVATGVTWSPDGSRVASSAGTGNSIHVWDPSSAETLLVIDLPGGITGNLRDMALNVIWTPDGQRLLVMAGDRYLLGSQDFDVLLYDAASGELLSSAEIPNQARPVSGEQGASFVLYPTGSAAVISPNDGRLATLGGDNTALIWDKDWQTPEIILSGHTDAVNSLDWSPDGSQLVTAGMDGLVRIWDAVTGEATLRLEGHKGRVAVAKWSPDGDLIASAGEDGTVRLWKPDSGDLIRVIEPDTESVWSLAWSPDSQRLVTGHHDGRLAMWGVEGGDLLTILAGHEGLISDLAWSPIDDRLASSDNSGFVRIWNAAPTTAWRTIPVNYAQGVDWTADSQFLVVAGGDPIDQVEPPSLAIWDVEADQIVQELTGLLDLNPVFTFFSPDDQVALFQGTKGFPDWLGQETVYAVDPWDGNITQTFTVDDGRIFRSINWSPDGELVVGGMFRNNEIWIWNYPDGQLVQKLLLRGSQPDMGYNFVTFSPDGSKLAGAKFDTLAPVWDTRSWELLYTIDGHEPPAEIWSVSFSPDGSKLLTASGSEEKGAKDKTARVWDAETGEELLALQGHTKSLIFAFWSPDGQRIVTASMDNTVRIWDATTGDELHTISPPPAIYGMLPRWSPDGRYLTSSGLGTPTSVWRVWQSKDELIDYTRECCIFRELTQGEMERYGLNE